MQLVWFRNDLRTVDHEALNSALQQGPTIALFLWSGAQWRNHHVGQPRLALLRRSLAALRADLQKLNVLLLIVRADQFTEAPRVVTQVASGLGADQVHCIEEFPLNERIRDSKVANACQAAGITLAFYEGGAILPPGAVLKDNQQPYSVFTPFKRRWLQTCGPSHREPLEQPDPATQGPEVNIAALSNVPICTEQCLDLKQEFDGVDASRLAPLWPAGQAEAQRRLEQFVAKRIHGYQDQRDVPGTDGTSSLSPYLAIGALSARTALAAAYTANDNQLQNGDEGIDCWINELIWRDFYRHVVTHFPQVSRGEAFRRETDQIAWRHAADDLAAWQEARTGYPLVDAAMNQLRNSGWMHNRLRMVSAMFLSKHLLLDWRLGERFFMQQLVDGDFAANNGGWQWSASTGTDAAPYFRIFNPVTQAQRYDPDGRFVLEQLPALAPLAKYLDSKKQWFFQPWKGPELPTAYCHPIVDHGEARARALAAFKRS